MIFLGNYKDWISRDLLDTLISETGKKVPVWQPDKWKDHPTLDEFREKTRPGYSEKDYYFHQFNSASPELEKFDIDLNKLPIEENESYWWFIKLYPGEFQPMHIDPQLVYAKSPQRYTLFLQDWQPGHIYTWENQMITDYKAGDFFKWEDPMCIHGAVNIGFEPRLTLQITTYTDLTHHFSA
jgi:hypothetical protein